MPSITTAFVLQGSKRTRKVLRRCSAKCTFFIFILATVTLFLKVAQKYEKSDEKFNSYMKMYMFTSQLNES